MNLPNREPTGEDGALQAHFYDLILPLEGKRDGFDPYPRQIPEGMVVDRYAELGYSPGLDIYQSNRAGVILLAGKPGSGKTTVSRELTLNKPKHMSLDLDIYHLSIGEVLRGVASGQVESAYSDEVTEYASALQHASPLPHDIVAGVVEESIASQSDSALVLLDGYPRFVSQVDAYKNFSLKLGRKTIGLVEFTLSDEAVRQRIVQRGNRDGEVSADETLVTSRLQEYNEHIRPTIAEIVSQFGIVRHEIRTDVPTIEQSAKALGKIITDLVEV